MCLWNRVRTYLFLPFGTTLVRQPHYAGGRCAEMLDGNVLMLVHPSSGDNIFYKVREDKSVVLLDSFGNKPKNEDRKNYTLRKK